MEIIREANDHDECDKGDDETCVYENVAEDVMSVSIGVEDECTANQQREVEDQNVPKHGREESKLFLQGFQLFFLFCLVNQYLYYQEGDQRNEEEHG